ncbi:MAG TPA: hypothetical protein VKR60_06485 [Candidatus Sulfotelmatobacter sp.]|nr:hypothetical protein [Candidatus Sulfotelmatobacter sp.]
MSIHRRHQAERLMRQLAALQQNGTSPANVKQIAKVSGGKEHCANDSCTYDFECDSGFFGSRLLQVFQRTEWDYLALRPWKVAAQIRTSNGNLTDFYVQAWVGRGRGWLWNEGLLAGNMWAWLMVDISSNPLQFDQRIQREREYLEAQSVMRTFDPGNNGIFVGKPNVDTLGSGEALTVDLSPSAPPESRTAGFDVNLRCATAITPCTHLCQFAPSAWHVYVEYRKSNGWWTEEPSECPTRPVGR